MIPTALWKTPQEGDLPSLRFEATLLDVVMSIEVGPDAKACDGLIGLGAHAAFMGEDGAPEAISTPAIRSEKIDSDEIVPNVRDGSPGIHGSIHGVTRIRQDRDRRESTSVRLWISGRFICNVDHGGRPGAERGGTTTVKMMKSPNDITGDRVSLTWICKGSTLEFDVASPR